MGRETTGNLKLTKKDMAYENISDRWEEFISHYDMDRRIEVLVDDFLGENEIKGKKCLDAGCGLGYFSQAILKYRPASLYACDISPSLVEKLMTKIPGVHCFVSNILEFPDSAKNQTFDIVVCSDVIEHTPNPETAIKKLTKVVAPGGLLSISVPNRMWLWLLKLAILIGLRKNYSGYENYVFPKKFKAWIEREGFEIIHFEGIHTVPFKIFPKKLLRVLDKKLRRSNYGYALNLAILAKKR